MLGKTVYCEIRLQDELFHMVSLYIFICPDDQYVENILFGAKCNPIATLIMGTSSALIFQFLVHPMGFLRGFLELCYLHNI